MNASFVDPGALRAEFALEVCEPEPDGLGGFTDHWVEIATLFGRVEPVSAQMAFAANQTLESVTHRITLRWRAGVASGMRLTKQDRHFDIVTVHDPDESRRYLMCRVKEIGL